MHRNTAARIAIPRVVSASLLILPLLLLLCAAAFAAPSPVQGTGDLQLGESRDLSPTPVASYVPVNELPIQKRGLAQLSTAQEDVKNPAVDGDVKKKFPQNRFSKSAKFNLVQQDWDSIKTIEKELSELLKFRYHNDNTRMDQLVESELADNQGHDRTEIIRQGIQLFRKLHPFKATDDLMKEKLPALLDIPPDRVMLGVDAARSRTVIEVMEKLHYRGNDDEMDRLLRMHLGQLVGREIRDELSRDIRDFRRRSPGQSLEEGDELLIRHLQKNFKLLPSETRPLIHRSREEMLIGKKSIAYQLVYYNDDPYMDMEIQVALNTKINGVHLTTGERRLSMSKIRQAIAKARATIKQEKKELDATQLAVYDDDQKMSEFLRFPKDIIDPTEIQKTIREVRWKVTLYHAISNGKKWALNLLIRAKPKFQKKGL